MKLAVLSDIHGNLAALQAIADDIDRWQADTIVVAGDVINRGPLPRQCLDFVFAREATAGWRLLRGNHEEYVLGVIADPSPRAGVEEAVRASVRWTAAQVGDPAAIAAMATIVQLPAPDGGEVRIVHASMRHNRDNILPQTSDEELRAKIAPAPPLFVCGHTHRPLIRQLDQTLVVNAGSVGLPFDGDTCASYARLTWREGWQAEITRVPYDREQAAIDYEQSGFLHQSGPLGPLIFTEFQHAKPFLSTWYQRYEVEVLAGALTAAQSVATFLRDLPEQQ